MELEKREAKVKQGVHNENLQLLHLCHPEPVNQKTHFQKHVDPLSKLTLSIKLILLRSF